MYGPKNARREEGYSASPCVYLTFQNEYMLCGQKQCFTSFHIAF